MAKEYLSQKGITYTEHNVIEDRAAALEMIRKSGQRGVPVILVEQDMVIGFQQAALDKLLS